MRYRLALVPFTLLLLGYGASAQGPNSYRLQYVASGDSRVNISLTLAEPAKAPLTLVVPRTYPGGYEQIPYDSFVKNLLAFSSTGKPLTVRAEAVGPRWIIGQAGEQVQRIEYQSDIALMEQQLKGAVETSKVRPNYAGFLGYSIFAYVDGQEDRQINLRIDGPPGWPVLTTLAPRVPAPALTTIEDAPNYYALADSQILMGPSLQVRSLDGKIPLIMAVYAECEEDLSIEGQLARQALNRIQDYFGDMPIKQYTVQLELLKPLPGHEYDFSQEHLDSGTFSLSIGRALTVRSTSPQRQLNLFNYAHHMAHSWIPKRAWGVGYLPFTWEMAPVIDTIWVNEGFIHYVAIEALAEAMPATEGAAYRDDYLAGLRTLVSQAPPFIRRMPLVVLSREASFLYMDDPRTGKNVYARGALMAAEMDDRMRTGGTKSLRDALRSLLVWSETNRRPYQIEELPGIFSEATGVDVHDIMDRWLKPLAP
jgi:predicted metalloprotease with PDZ domain